MENAIRKFLAHLHDARGSAENTILAYRADLKQFNKVIVSRAGGPVRPEYLSKDLLAIYMEWLDDQGYRPATISRKVSAIRSFLDYLVMYEGLPLRNLESELRSAPAPRQRPRVLTVEQVNALLSAPEQSQSPRALRDAAILAMLYATGMRAAEIVQINVDDLDLNKRSVKCDRGYRLLKLGRAGDSIEKYLKDGRPHLARYPEEKGLFLNQRGRKLSRQGLWLIVKRWAREAGLEKDVSPYTLRHTLAHHLLSEGESPQEVQHLLGLKSPNSIRVFDKISSE
jgi:integrase/recombinase XerD